MIMILIIILPFLTGCICWAIAKHHVAASRWLAAAGVTLDLALILLVWFNPNFGGPSSLRAPWMMHVQMPWIPQFGITFQLALDGLGLVLITLTAFLGIIAVVISATEIKDKIGFFHFNLLTVISGLMGVFTTVDLILFYFFWEVMLVPMYFLIAIWGHEERVFAANKFFLFTQVGSLFMLFAMLGLYYTHARTTGIYTFDYFQLLGTITESSTGMLLALGFSAAFAVKLPMFLFHTWLPDAHTEAPTAGSLILAGLLLKSGAYGFIRFVIPLFPEAAVQLAPAAMLFGVLGIIYGAAMAFAQTDLKRLVAYSSVSHLGFVLIGIFTFNEIALQGAILQMIAHGFSTGALFIIVGMLQERIHTRNMDKMGGLWSTVPILSAFSLVFALASLGLPGTANFAGEFLTLLGTYQVSFAATAFAASGLVFSAVYSLYMVYRVFYGPQRKTWTIPDVSLRELSVIAVMTLVIFAFGIHPKPILEKTAPVVQTITAGVKSSQTLFSQLLIGSNQESSK